MALDLEQLFLDSLELFLTENSDSILDGVSERNLCARLGQILESKAHGLMLTEYFADVEYNRMQNRKLKMIRRGKEIPISICCDLILHSRGKFTGEKDNLIAIEMKRSTSSAVAKNKDRNRLIALTSSPYDQIYSYDGRAHPETVCGYGLGVYVELNVRKQVILVETYENGCLSSESTINF